MLKATARRLLLACCLGLCILPLESYAQSPQLSVDIPAGELAAALDLLARQLGVDLVYRPEQVQGMKTRGVRGRLSRRDAVAKLIEGTLLTLSTDASGAMMIAAPLPSADKSLSSGVDSRPVIDARDSMRLVRTGAVRQQEPAEGDGAEETRSASQETGTQKEETQQIVVTGSMLRRRNSTTPLTTIDREEIERLGVTTAEDILRTLPQNFSAVTSVSTSRADTDSGQRLDPDGAILAGAQGQAAANLRGLGTGSTLVLVNGRRTGGSAIDQGNFVNLSTIPADAIERVEILTEGASALYGADAIAGVINFILRKDYVGATSALRHEHSATEADEMKFVQTMGYSWETGNVTLTATASRRDSIETTRIFTSNDFRPYGSRDFRATDGANGKVYYNDNYRIVNGLSGPLALPDGVSLVDSGATFVTDPIWGPTLDDPGAFSADLAVPFDDVGQDYSQDTRNVSASLYLNQQLSRSVNAYVELIHAVDDSHRIGDFTSLLLVMLPEEEVPGNGNISGDWMIGSTILDFAGRTIVDTRSRNTDVVLGLGWDLPFGDWRLDSALSWLDNKSDSVTYGIDWVAAQNLSYSVFDIFGGMTAAERQEFVDLNGFVSVFRPTNVVTSINERLEGGLFDLPGGSLRLGLGLEYRKEKQDFSEDRPNIAQSFPGGADGTQARDGVTQQKRTVKAAFSELLIPVVGADNGFRGMRSLEFSVGLRWEEYEYFNVPSGFLDLGGLREADLDALLGVFGGAEFSPRTGQLFSNVSPRIALSWRPMQQLNLRASWAEAFRAPRTNEMMADEGTPGVPLQWRDIRNNPAIFRSRDPLHPDIDAGNPEGFLDWYMSVSSGNPFLKPETSDNYTVGFDWMPPRVEGLRMSMSYFRIDYSNRITAGLPFQFRLTNPQTAVRDEDGYLLYFRTMPININKRESRSIDFNLKYERSLGFGTVLAGLGGTYTLAMTDYLPASASTSSRLERLDTDKGPRQWQGAFNLGWSQRNLGMDVYVRYASPFVYEAFSVTPRFEVDSTTTIDISGRYSFDRGKWDVLGGVRNLTNELTFNGQPGFVDSLAVDPRGRVMYLEIRKSFDL